ncbi:bifunctional 4-hydroxy-2-oxoglutarate aldolase/2-dehydro-3-deoxy-phosphogluconate aldolase [Micromonospora sp. WMMD1076]|uniref:bifunctional 4-hydroxy-2-oxoglutarate aldolase/2-dehydro-3-deoxy-phosphogluconate aldolase n=1 Tax=Micromonospora sp. WMMD1076 TaxID=3016103 RepID=UPI00249CB62F|nr:bifunctional 4-hydroxy-2-oxoglutarate aldolase/2-dehydro-3-deoxy-phosphogluconate aldolase [Micromonospora sp. WMMD1076]WFF09849.1 bifunctional 4-hydroxy-2-oxoglutarate aldolase/2-dehydro-3-deoxy-phosphogluconate aldolase [Micromonospora sp. WMMD1076]
MTNVPLSEHDGTVTHPVTAAVARRRLLPVVVLRDARAAEPLASALIAGGLHTAEVTLRTDAAIHAIRAMATLRGFLVGAGTVLTPAQVDRAVEAGARFVVSPGFSPAVVRRCQDIGVPVFPGVATATEVQMALDAGLDTVKFFPAEQLGGAAMVRALAAPFPSVRFIPTGGIHSGNLPAYLAQPAVLAVGGTWMVAPDLLAQADWNEITRLTQAATSAAGEV